MEMSFIFAEHMDLAGCLCVRLGNDNIVIAPCAYRLYADVQAMQGDSHTVIVLPTARCGLYDVDLPWLGGRKARLAIPFALEEQLAQKLSTLHFAFDRAHHQNNRYLVTVVDKSYVVSLMLQLETLGISFHEMTPDWFALHPGEVALTESSVLVRTAEFQGALSDNLADTYLSTDLSSVEVLSFTDSAADRTRKEWTTIDSSFFLWAAQRLQHGQRMNICQGELSHGREDDTVSRPMLYACMAVVGFWLVSVLAVNSINLIRLHHQLNKIDEETAVVYREFFPQAEKVISPRFRITQLLKGGYAGQDAAFLWQLLDKLEKAVNIKNITVKQLDYKNKVLSVMLTSRDFAALEQLDARLKKANVKVQQTQALSYEEHVEATLELRL